MRTDAKKKGQGFRSQVAFFHDNQEGSVLTALRESFSVRSDSVGRTRLTFFDTFDWRLHRRELALVGVDGPEQHFVQLQTLDSLARSSLRIAEVPAFARDFPPGGFRDEVAALVEMRCLFPVVVVETSGRRMRILNSSEKTVAFVRFEESSVASPHGAVGRPMTARLTVDPIRGYDKPFKRLVTFIEGGLELERAGLGILDEALEALGRTSRDYSSKLSLSLNPRERSDVALKSILAILFDTMLRNEKGTKDDTDSEFLHDFRVAVRRTRSALALIRKVFPDETVSFFKKEFSWLGGVTGPTRDLDVYLLKMPTYQRLLSDRVSADLKPLHSFLTQLQVEEQRRLRRVLESERYRQIVRGWSAFLTAPAVESPGCRDASRPISEVARGRIWKTYRKVLRDGSAISSRSPAEKLHRLRIDCKKLRYLLEFFGSLFERQTVRVLIRALKRLQDHLGDFNDYEVQQSKMEEFSDEMMSRGPVAPRTLLAMGRLVEKLEEGQEIERRRFHGRFARFSSPDNQKDFGRLFAPTSQDV